MNASFPCGLEQPEGSFRFSMDALLLAAFAAQEKERLPVQAYSTTARTFVDLGTGCGVVGFALLLLTDRTSSGWRGLGLDVDAELIAAAQRNATQLGFADRFLPFQVDVAAVDGLRSLRRQHGAADLVLANPPWRLEGSGRTPASPARRRALFGDHDTLRRFAWAASVLSAEKGRFVCILGVQRLPDMLRALDDAHLHPFRLRFVHKQSTSPALLCLLEARRSAGSLCVEPPLVLYDAEHCPTAASLAFCPFLGHVQSKNAVGTYEQRIAP